MQMCYEYAYIQYFKIIEIKKNEMYFFLNFKNEKMKMYNFDIEKCHEILFNHYIIA